MKYEPGGQLSWRHVISFSSVPMSLNYAVRLGMSVQEREPFQYRREEAAKLYFSCPRAINPSGRFSLVWKVRAEYLGSKLQRLKMLGNSELCNNLPSWTKSQRVWLLTLVANTIKVKISARSRSPQHDIRKHHEVLQLLNYARNFRENVWEMNFYMREFSSFIESTNTHLSLFVPKSLAY